MPQRRLTVIVLLLLSACAPVDDRARPSSPPPAAAAGEVTAPAAPLTPEEEQLAAEIAGRALTERSLMVGPIFVVDTELLRDKNSARRMALVTHYRYAGDLTISAVVDLTGRRAEQVRTAAHVPTPLSAEELEQAREMALADPAVGRALDAYRDGLVVEPLVVHAASPDDPLFGDRVVRLLFRVGRDYLSAPEVLVNLTERRVMIVEPRPQ